VLADDALPQARGNQGAGFAAPPRVVIDSNVWLDLFVFRDPAAQPLAQALRVGSLAAVRSHQTDAELIAVLARPRFAALIGTSASALMQQWQALAQCFAGLDRAPWLCRDPHDQKFLDLAYSAHARTLFTKDRALLRLARAAYRDGLQIICPLALDAAHDSCPVQNPSC